jgi:hypothetical protein
MTAQMEELFDTQILRVLDLNAGKEFGLGAESIQMLIPRPFSTATIEEINKRLAYMADAEIGFVATINKGHFNPGNKTWRITAKGINHLRMAGH